MGRLTDTEAAAYWKSLALKAQAERDGLRKECTNLQSELDKAVVVGLRCALESAKVTNEYRATIETLHTELARR